MRVLVREYSVQGYLAHNRPRPLRTLQQDYAQGTMVVLNP